MSDKDAVSLKPGTVVYSRMTGDPLRVMWVNIEEEDQVIITLTGLIKMRPALLLTEAEYRDIEQYGEDDMSYTRWR